MTILDVGAGSHSGSITKRWYPDAVYHGIDRTKEYQNEASDIEAMDRFIEMDVTKLDFTNIQDGHYDLIILSHIIEHLLNGDEVMKGLLRKLKQGGLIYVEFPSTASTTLPSMKGTLNFYDDETHCRIFTRNEIETLFRKNGMEIVCSRVRRDWMRILLIPLYMINAKIKYGYIAGSVFWDLFGFAEVVIAKKT